MGSRRSFFSWIVAMVVLWRKSPEMTLMDPPVQFRIRSADTACVLLGCREPALRRKLFFGFYFGYLSRRGILLPDASRNRHGSIRLCGAQWPVRRRANHACRNLAAARAGYAALPTVGYRRARSRAGLPDSRSVAGPQVG